MLDRIDRVLSIIVSRATASPAQHQENLAFTRQTKAMLDRLYRPTVGGRSRARNFAGIRPKPMLRFAVSLRAKSASGEPMTNAHRR